MKPISRRIFIKKSLLGLAGYGLASGFLGGLPVEATTGESAAPDLKDECLSFIHVTDTHLDLGKPQSVSWLEMFVERINKDYSHIDLVVFGGDNFNNNVPGQKDAETFKKIVDQLKCPWYSVRGNKESSPKPANDPLNQDDYAKMFFTSGAKVSGRDWSLEKGRYTILGVDTTIEHHNNGMFTPESMDFVEDQLKNNKDRYFILLNHQVYWNFWGEKDQAAIHKYVLNNADQVKKRLFKYPNLKLTLSGHKHLDNVTRDGHVNVISTLGFIVPQGTKKDHQFRVVEMKNGNIVRQQVAGIL